MSDPGADPGPALAAWGRDAAVLERLGGGARNRVWAVRVGGRRAVARDSGTVRSGPALDWELDLIEELAGAGFTVPRPLPDGDPGPQNLRLRGDGVGLLDWDESRVDCPELDLAWLPVDRLGARRGPAQTAAEAWEVANGWLVEPEHARRRLAELRRLWTAQGP